MVEEVESPGSMALSVESCVWSRVCGGLVGGETSSLGSVGEGEEVLVLVLVVAVAVVVQVRSVLALPVMGAGGL